MQETFLHYLFEYQLIDNTEFEIISPGQKNTDAGPDFFNSKIKIGDTIWAGNVEIHILSSDWNRHQHQNDKAYDNIVLHLVLTDDAEIITTDGRVIPSYEIKFDPQLYLNYTSLIESPTWVHCQNQLQLVDSFTLDMHIESLATERLQRKSILFEDMFQFNNNDWNETFYQLIAKGFGSKINQIPFELLSKSLSFSILQKHSDNLLQIEALLFGQAGLLDQDYPENKYFIALKDEYHFLRQKYQLKNIRSELWKFSKIRPYNFPTIKLALFSRLIFTHRNLFSKLLDCKTLDELYSIFEIEASDFWTNHYVFEKDSKSLVKRLGKSSIQHLIINIIIPFLYTYGHRTGKNNIQALCINWFSEIEPESNNITRKWSSLGLKNPNALISQGLIELKNEKCNKHQCLDCRIAHKILTLSWNENNK